MTAKHMTAKLASSIFCTVCELSLPMCSRWCEGPPTFKDHGLSNSLKNNATK